MQEFEKDAVSFTVWVLLKEHYKALEEMEFFEEGVNYELWVMNARRSFWAIVGITDLVKAEELILGAKTYFEDEEGYDIPSVAFHLYH